MPLLMCTPYVIGSESGFDIQPKSDPLILPMEMGASGTTFLQSKPVLNLVRRGSNVAAATIFAQGSDNVLKGFAFTADKIDQTFAASTEPKPLVRFAEKSPLNIIAARQSNVLNGFGFTSDKIDQTFASTPTPKIVVRFAQQPPLNIIAARQSNVLNGFAFRGKR